MRRTRTSSARRTAARAGDSARAAAPDRLRPASVALRRVVLGVAGLYVAVYLVLAGLRLGYPFELEWMEGGAVDHVRRIAAGHPLYVAPALEFVPFIYPPLYFYVSALVAQVVGAGFAALRLVSVAASIGCFAVLFVMVRRETASAFAGALAVGLFAATYRVAGAWFDIARVDTLALLLLLGAVYLLQREGSLAAHLGAAVLLALSFLTKQTGLVMAAPLVLFAAVYRGRRGLAFAAATAVLAGASTLALNQASGGWYNYYVFHLPGRHELLPDAIRDFWRLDMVGALPAALPAAGYFLVTRFSRRAPQGFLLWAAAAIGIIGGSWMSRAHGGGYNNVLMPAYAIVAALAAMGAHAALAWAGKRPPSSRRAAEIAIYALCLAQLGRLYYNPARQLPTAEDRRAGEQLVTIMRRVPGEVLMPDHGYLPTLAGKGAYAQGMALYDVQRGDPRRADDIGREFARAVAERRFAAIIADQGTWLPDNIAAHYAPQPLPLDRDAFWPVTGMKTRPLVIYVPIGDEPPAP